MAERQYRHLLSKNFSLQGWNIWILLNSSNFHPCPADVCWNYTLSQNMFLVPLHCQRTHRRQLRTVVECLSTTNRKNTRITDRQYSENNTLITAHDYQLKKLQRWSLSAINASYAKIWPPSGSLVHHELLRITCTAAPGFGRLIVCSWKVE